MGSVDDNIEVAKVHSNEEGLRSKSEQQLSRDDAISSDVEQDAIAVERVETINRQPDPLPSQEELSHLSMGAGKLYPPPPSSRTKKAILWNLMDRLTLPIRETGLCRESWYRDEKAACHSLLTELDGD